MRRLLACLALVLPGLAHATADGPDYFQVVGVAKDDVLNMRASPNAKGTLIGEIPPDTDGITWYDCVGGLHYAEWAAATEAEREEARRKRWCLVGYDMTIGWSAGRFFGEGWEPVSFKGGAWLIELAGSEWGLRDFPGEPVETEAWIAFKPDGKAIGHGGCNRFSGSYEESEGGKLSLGPVAATRMACVGPGGAVEARFFEVLEKTDSVVAAHLLMVLLDAENNILATFRRRDWD